MPRPCPGVQGTPRLCSPNRPGLSGAGNGGSPEQSCSLWPLQIQQHSRYTGTTQSAPKRRQLHRRGPQTRLPAPERPPGTAAPAVVAPAPKPPRPEPARGDGRPCPGPLRPPAAALGRGKAAAAPTAAGHDGEAAAARPGVSGARNAAPRAGCAGAGALTDSGRRLRSSGAAASSHGHPLRLGTPPLPARGPPFPVRGALPSSRGPPPRPYPLPPRRSAPPSPLTTAPPVGGARYCNPGGLLKPRRRGADRHTHAERGRPRPAPTNQRCRRLRRPANSEEGREDTPFPLMPPSVRPAAAAMAAARPVSPAGLAPSAVL